MMSACIKLSTNIAKNILNTNITKIVYWCKKIKIFFGGKWGYEAMDYEMDHVMFKIVDKVGFFFLIVPNV